MQTDPCEHCGVRPKFVDNGTVLDYCGKACAVNAKQAQAKPIAPKSKPIPSAVPASTNTSDLCSVCGQRPKYNDGTKTYDYCGKFCAAQIQAAAPPSAPAATAATTAPAAGVNPDLCTICGKRPKFNDGTNVHDYCGKACAAKANSNNGTIVPPLNTNTVVPSAMPATKPAASSATAPSNLCTVCGQRPKFKDGNKVHDFCGKACATKAQGAGGGAPAPKPDLCTVCGQRPKFNDGKRTLDYCGKYCAAKTQAPAPAAVVPPPAPAVKPLNG